MSLEARHSAEAWAHAAFGAGPPGHPRTVKLIEFWGTLVPLFSDMLM